MNSIPDSIRETCDLCDGHGRLGLGSECPPCKGSGVRIRSPYAAKSSVGLYDDDDVRVRELEHRVAKLVAFWSDIEQRSSDAHDVYQAEAHRRGDVRHADAYADLSEATKEWDRVLVRWVLEATKNILGGGS